jgi:two-component system OmpR family response regulator
MRFIAKEDDVSDKRKILIIDDEQEICDLTKAVLSRSGRFEVFASTKAKEGIELARLKKPDLILLDVMMPDMSGTEVAKRLCEDDQTKDSTIVFVTAIAIPMVFLTSLMEIDVLKQKAGLAGGQYFIQKPISPQELIQRLDAILNDKK